MEFFKSVLSPGYSILLRRLASQIVKIAFVTVASASASVNAAERAAANTADIEIRKLGSGVWMQTSYYIYPNGVRFPSNGLIVREDDGLLLVDTAWGEMLTVRLLEEIKAKIGLPVRRAVISHAHGDRLAGVDVLEARGIEVYATLLTQERAVGEGMPVPNRILAKLDSPGMSIQFGTVELFYPGSGHAPDNLVVWVPSERVLFGGCAVRAAASDSPGGVADANMKTWPEAVRLVRARYSEAAIVVPGHGDAGDAGLLDHTLALFNQFGEGG